MPWKELVRIALIGTDRAKMSPELLKNLETLGVDISKESTQVLLEGASMLSLINKTQGQLEDWKGTLSTPCKSDSANHCNPKSSNHLSLILNGNYELALSEFLSHLINNNKSLPPEMLPDLLDQCLTNPELWSKLRFTIGERGEWLIQQNPDWQSLTSLPQKIEWETGSSDQRIALLKHLRKQEPEKVVPIIETTWEEDSLKDRVHFIETLEINLSKKDDPFLEKCLDNNRKEIRKAAAKLLTLLPDSELVHRMFDRLKDLMILKSGALKKSKLEVSLPENDIDELVRDGIDPAVQWYKGGLKASRLGQMVAIVPPSFWEKYFKKNTEETLQLFIRSNWSELLLQALSEATFKHKKEKWMQVIVTFWIENHNRQRWDSFTPKKILEVLPAPLFNNLAIVSLKPKDNIFDENAPITEILKSSNHFWENELTLKVIQKMQDWIAGASSGYWSGWHLRTILNQAAYACNPNLFETLQKGWTTNSYIWTSWERDIDNFLSVLKFRKEMIEELKKS
jgi:Family of unknown function (DUF5691)